VDEFWVLLGYCVFTSMFWLPCFVNSPIFFTCFTLETVLYMLINVLFSDFAFLGFELV
jgi:hypothetical protein